LCEHEVSLIFMSMESVLTRGSTGLYRARAEFWRTIAHAKRLAILDLLRDREASVTELATAMSVRAINVSQELGPLRRSGIVRARRSGKTVYYRVSDANILRACDLLAQIMRELADERVGTIRKEPDRLLRSFAE
jgi:ArsR family transcriptional regulator